MTELLNPVDAPSDAELISRVRGGDVDGLRGAALRVATWSPRAGCAPARRGPRRRRPGLRGVRQGAWTVLQGGGGPDVAFRAYLLTAVRRLHVDRVRARSRLTTTDDMTPFDPGVPFKDTAVGRASRAAPPPRRSPRCPSAGSWCCGTSRSRARSRPRSPRCSG